MSAFRDILPVFQLELRRSVGSIRGALVLLLYLFVSLGIGTFYSVTVHALETEAAKAVGTNHVDLGQSDAYKQLVRSFTDGDEKKAELWLDTPPIVLMSFYFELLILPFLILLAAHDVLARDTEQKTTRFIRPKCSPWSWVGGKFLAQLLLLFATTAISGLVIYGVALNRLDSFEAVAGGLAFGRFWLRLLACEIGFLGLTFLFSSLMSAAFTALLFSGVVSLFLWLLHWFIYLKDGDVLRPWGYVAYLSPFTYRSGLFLPVGEGFFASVAAYVGLAIACFGLVAWREGSKEL